MAPGYACHTPPAATVPKYENFLHNKNYLMSWYNSYYYQPEDLNISSCHPAGQWPATYHRVPQN